jgi:drug/metabolite transporter (DMT)-like permease
MPAVGALLCLASAVVLAYLAVGESLGPAQLVGAALVLAAVPVLAARGRRPRAVSALAVRRVTRSVVAWRFR